MQSTNDQTKPKVEIIYPELSHEVVNIAFEVHNQLGPGFTEDIYEKAFIQELTSRGIPFEEQKVITIWYKGNPISNYRLDLVIDEKIIVELKAVTKLNDIFKQQIYSYLKATQMQLGLLINFGGSKVEFYRIIYKKNNLNGNEADTRTF